MTDASSDVAAAACAPSSPRLLTLAQVCGITALSPSTIRRQIERKRMAVHRIGSMLRISETDLAAWLARHRRAAR